MQFQCTLFIVENQQQWKSTSGTNKNKLLMYANKALLKSPSSKRSPPKRLFERFYLMDLFLRLDGIYKNLVLNYRQYRVSLN